MSKPATTVNNVNTSKVQVVEQKTRWMRFDNKTFTAEDNIIANTLKTSGYGYRKVHNTDQVDKNKTLFGFGTDKIFFDDEWDVRATEDLTALEHVNSGKIVLRRLSHIYPSNPELRPKFFPANDYNEPLKKVEDLAVVPHFLHEMGLFPSSDFRSLFFTQDFQPSGLYHAVVNYNGRWETDVVDDFIPVYEKTGKPLWGMDLEQPWQLILLKFWAKRNYVLAKDNQYDMATKGGYAGVKNSAPMDFIHTFTNSNWKFVNLTVDYKKFMAANAGSVHKAHFILKSKNSNHVKDSGLIPNEACYELVNLVEEGRARSASGIKDSTTGTSKVGGKTSYVATIRSSNKTYWAGKKSVLDTEFKNLQKGLTSTYKESAKNIPEKTFNDKRSQIFSLDRQFTIDGDDLKNLFSCCYISPRRVGSNFVSGFYKFSIPANRTNAYYLQFNIDNDTFLDFSIKQLPSNKVTPKEASKLKAQKHQEEHGSKAEGSKIERYLSNKYILVKDNSCSGTTPQQVDYEKEYNRLNYETYEIEYLKGYNNGDAHFLNVVNGKYILRFKSEVIPRESHYVINYCSESDIIFKEFIPTKPVETKIMKDAMASTIDKMPRVNLTKGIDTETIAYGKTFDYVGYGFVGAKLKKTSKTQLLIDVDPELLMKEGYRLKHLYKTEIKPFAVIVNPGEATAIVLKRMKGRENDELKWPPNGIAIFQK